MTLATRIIPTLLCRNGQLVKGERFNPWRSVGVAAQAARIHNARSVDELILIDLHDYPGPNFELVRQVFDQTFCPITVGGGVRDVNDVHQLLWNGADKVCMCTAATDLARLEQIATAVGCQAITVAIDTRWGAVWTHNGKTKQPHSPVACAIKVADHGAGEILLTSIEHEGMMSGYDLETIHQVAAAVDIPVIAHGGAGTYEHMLQAVQAGASAVAAGAMFLFTDQTPLGAAEYLREHGVETRIPTCNSLTS